MPGKFGFKIEKFDGIPLSKLMARGLNEDAFQDYMLQIQLLSGEIF